MNGPARRATAALNIHDLRKLARRRLPRVVFEHVDRGTEDETALRRNRESLDRLTFLPRVLRDVRTVELGASLFGKPAAMPIGVSATGGAVMVAYDGDVALARAAREAGVPFMIAGAAFTDIERIAEVGGRLWYQFYAFNRSDDGVIERAQALGCEALVLTVDTAKSPNREYNDRNGFTHDMRPNLKTALDAIQAPGWLFGVALRHMLNGGLPTREAHEFRNELSWDDVHELRRVWRGPLILKGVLSPADAELAVQAGCDGVIVSNHGGRNLDYAAAAIDALPLVVEVVDGRIPVMFDSGVRRGGDVVKALALGAAFTFVGRATLYGLAAGGEAGVARALSILGSETRRVMGLCGCPTVEDITAELVFPGGARPVIHRHGEAGGAAPGKRIRDTRFEPD